MAADVRARARLIEVQLRGWRVEIAECSAGDVEAGEPDAAAFERGEQRLLPLRVFVENDEIEC
jgi:hypothetical protein